LKVQKLSKVKQKPRRHRYSGTELYVRTIQTSTEKDGTINDCLRICVKTLFKYNLKKSCENHHNKSTSVKMSYTNSVQLSLINITKTHSAINYELTDFPYSILST